MSASVLFLDVDGVLNCTEFYRREQASGRKHRYLALCKERIALLNEIVERTGCTVTVSSTWREMKACRRLLRDRGVRVRYSRDWRTKWLRTCEGTYHLIRGDEIAEWLQRNGSPRYAIVDDDSDMLEEQRPFFVQTSHETGLLREHVERLVALLAPAALPCGGAHHG